MKLFTIGHSTHTVENLVRLLERHQVTSVCDVRSQPYSRFNPQFNRESLKRDLAAAGISYVFLGSQLGARSDEPSCYRDGQVQYDRIAGLASFEEGIRRVKKELEARNTALLCAEKDPLACHRTILVARQLAKAGVTATHILEDGSLETYQQGVDRLRVEEKMQNADLFRSFAQLEEDAFKAREAKIAYRDKADGSTETNE